MIYQYHIDFLDEPILQTPIEKNSRGIVPVVEDIHLKPSAAFQNVSSWYPVGETEVRYFLDNTSSEGDNDISWGLEVKDVLILFWCKEKEEIHYRKGKNYRPERLQFWVFHTFLPIMFERREIFHILHVGSVEIEGRPVLFSAHSHGGKSTMTDYFIHRGHTMLSDDALGIEKSETGYCAIASYPYHRPYRKAEDLGYLVKHFSMQNKPISALYLLNKSESEKDIKTREITGVEKFKAFHFSSYVMFNFIKERRFRFFANMAEVIPVYEITYPHDINRLPEVYQKIIECQKNIK
jgi:hypothetical protein